MSPGSVTEWFLRLEGGDQDAAQKLWELYFRRLLPLARKKLKSTPRRMADEEDVVLSAFNTFCLRARQGRFPWLKNRQGLWQLLVVITVRKAYHLARHEDVRRPRGGAVIPESTMTNASGLGPEESVFEQCVGREPDPAFAALLTQEYQRLMNLLGDDELRAIALWDLEGYSQKEIADRLGCVDRTVRRRLGRIYRVWEKNAPHGPDTARG
jgi:DNA-directed RNA polymerase specialized sigma24 family protein